MDGQDVLRETARLIEHGWCQHADARDPSGTAVTASDPSATAWSLTAALALASDTPKADPIALRDALWGISAAIPDSSLDAWNNAPNRTQTETLRMLAHASTSLHQQPPPSPWPAE